MEYTGRYTILLY